MNTKYPRTYHFPFSPEVHSDDKVLHDISNFIGREVVITEKLDGGNTCLSDNVYGRTHATPTFCPTFNYIKNVHFFPKKHLFKEGYRYFGENLYAIHSIEYFNLKDYFYLFGIFDEKNVLSYDDMVKEAKRLDFLTAPFIFRGVFNTEKELQDFLEAEMKKESFLGGEREGFVVRIADSFPVDKFSENVIKYVRKGHVQTEEHWSRNWKQQKLNQD